MYFLTTSYRFSQNKLHSVHIDTQMIHNQSTAKSPPLSLFTFFSSPSTMKHNTPGLQSLIRLSAFAISEISQIDMYPVYADVSTMLTTTTECQPVAYLATYYVFRVYKTHIHKVI